jgi:uncharacterized membrane protein YbhN (UPF0104 family)
MGRLRIKKKEAVIPFRETVAYRMILASGSLLVFFIALYFAIRALGTGNTVSSIVSAVVGIAAIVAVFQNLDRLRDARVPQKTLKRMKRH